MDLVRFDNSLFHFIDTRTSEVPRFLITVCVTRVKTLETAFRVRIELHTRNALSSLF